MNMRIIRIIAPWLLLLLFTCSWAGAQDAPPEVELFGEGGGSFLSNGAGTNVCPPVCPTSGCPPCPPFSFSHAERLLTGTRFRSRHDAIEVSYSRSNQLAQQYNRLDLISFNYVRYLWIRSNVQPFATAGLGTNRFSGPSTPASGFQFAWNYGGGADVVLQRHLALRLELRDYVTGRPGFGTTIHGHDIVPSVGIVFRLK
jgi:hypothetical protein